MRVSRRSERALLSVANALLPPPPAPRSPELDERVTSHARVMLQYMPRVTALALLFFVRLLDWAPVWRFVALKRLRSLSPARASAVLSGIANSRLLLVRLLLQGPKALVLTTYFDQDEVHRALDYEPKGFLRERIARRDTLLRVLDEAPRLHALDETHGYHHPSSEPSPQPSPGGRGGDRAGVHE
jgi:hypothetical protein